MTKAAEVLPKAGLHQTHSQTVLARPKIILKRVGNELHSHGSGH